MAAVQLYLPLAPYFEVRDGNPLALAIAKNHYSQLWRGQIHSPRFMPPGKRLILVHPIGLWLFAWSFQKHRLDKQQGVCCTLFRNESDIKSSEIILMAEAAWDAKYGSGRKFTYVHPKKIRSTNPGYCFQCAGWKKIQNHKSTRGLILLTKENTPANTLTEAKS